MSTLKKILLIVLIGLVLYIISTSEIIKNINLPQFLNFNTTKDSCDDNIEHFNEETTEKESLQLTSPTLNTREINEFIKFKDTIVKPFTSIGTHPDINQFQSINNLDFKNLQAYLAELLQNVFVDNNTFKIIPSNITPNLYVSFNTNLAFFTPIELEGTIFINDKLFGDINMMFIIKGSTNSVYVPDNGVFLSGKKYKMYQDTVVIKSITKHNTPKAKQKGFYAVSENLDMQVNNQPDFHNKTPQEIKLQRKENNPLTTITELEDSEDNFNLSEIIKDVNIEPDSENVTSIDINY